MKSDGYGFCESCRNITDLYRCGDFLVCDSCLPVKYPTGINETSKLELRRRRAEISRNRKLARKDHLHLVRTG